MAVGAAAGRRYPAEAGAHRLAARLRRQLVSVAVRAVPLGQSDAVAVIAGLEDVILRTAARAAEATL